MTEKENLDCPKCGSENSLVGSSHLKWGKVNKWQHFLECSACKYESKVD
jgi:ssDNA-binding Zn-finger/Zn-ribbon topoisomerase 1